MKENELRIGNLIQLNPELDWIGAGDKTIKIESISEDGINYSNYPEMGVYWQSLDDQKLVPIPLTEEWLIKLGFESKHSDTTHYYVKRYYTESDDRKYLFKLQRFYNDNYFTTSHIKIHDLRIKYVHQLQNLYFALTVKEL